MRAQKADDTAMTYTKSGMPNDESAHRIVVGIDGSEASELALRWAIDEAALRGGRIDALHAWHELYFGGGISGTVSFVDPKLYADAAEALLDAVVDSVDESDLRAPIRRLVTHGSPAHALLEAAKGADMIVVGSRGRGGFAGLLLGSVSQQAVHHAHCPVVVVPLVAD